MASVQMLSLWLRYPITWWIILLLPTSVLPETIYRVDPLALLSATLRTYQRAGCDTEQVSLSCPRGTSISIELAQYGRAGDITDNSLCPATSEDETTAMLDQVHSGTEIEVKPAESCSWPNALQYALLQTVVEACQKKRHCKFAAPSKSVTGDPCPGVRKFIEIAYKCRPYEFRSKVGCENDMIQLMCNPYSRIAIYEATFGRTEYESVQCAQPQGVKEETCKASYATETVMQICHGRRRCSLSADSGTFGKPCRSDSRMYLKVVYTCIPRKVLKDRYDTSPEPDEPQQSEFDIDQDELYDEDQFYKESEAIPPAPKLQGGLSNPGHPYDFPDESSSSVIPPLLSRNDNSLEEGQFPNGELGVKVSGDFDGNETLGYTESVVGGLSIPSSTTTTESFLIPKLANGDIFGHFGETNKEGVEKIEQFYSTTTAILPKYFIRRRHHHRHRHSDGPRKLSKEKVVGKSFVNDNDLLNSTESDFMEGARFEFECSPDPFENGERIEVIGFLAEWIQAYLFLAQNQERFYLYLIVSVAAGVLLCLILVVGRLVIHKRRRAKSDSKFQQSSTGETQLPNGFSDDISEIDADIDLTTPLPVPSVTRNENYMTYTPSPSPYGGSLAPSNVSHTSTTMLVPTSSLIVSGGSRQATPPPNMIPGGGPVSTYMGPPPPVSGPMGPLMPISSVSHHTTVPSYLPGAMMVSHHGTLRRTMVPAGSATGIMPSPSPTPPPTSLGVVTPNVCYEGTLPRSLSRGMPDNSQYYYG
ncbi:uncharacterized protein LOC119660163 isoform X2 [Hermetia illucens]|uniref:uncharacterized protein LOC119660163 isoform X2 n=1 Tax=Hermetia illucens TaxID=343691 RepID=UPI0018CC594C|nr:uncharacterized protein LOC119660163 isoform X2 [Hermetia illucens]